jgi:hypothetical protein
VIITRAATRKSTALKAGVDRTSVITGPLPLIQSKSSTRQEERLKMIKADKTAERRDKLVVFVFIKMMFFEPTAK